MVCRFFEAIQRLKDEKVIRGLQTYTRRYGINRRNFITCKRQPERDMFQVSWLTNLVIDYKVSPLWLLTGDGDFWQPGWNAESVKIVQNMCNEN